MISTRGEVSLHLVLTVFLGFGMVFFGTLTVLAYNARNSLQTDFDSKVARAVVEAKQKQKEEDTVKSQREAQLPYKTYVADEVNGKFELQVPKNWSVLSEYAAAGTNQLNLIAGPDYVYVNKDSRNTFAFQLELLRKPAAEIIKSYQDKVKKKTLTQKAVKVSGLDATQFEGVIDNENHNGVMVVLSVRDKTMALSTENRDYLPEFNEILAKIKINP
ncbi:MAG TPA: hypothetical protein VNA68_00255 [Candidatus Dormibacteraeota bacterium]|nr:hypothetical protein [Candidatus Dormibacteraeota bacterium]